MEYAHGTKTNRKHHLDNRPIDHGQKSKLMVDIQFLCIACTMPAHNPTIYASKSDCHK